MTFPLLEFELDTYGDQSQTSKESFTVKEEDILVLAQFWRSRSLCFTYQSILKPSLSSQWSLVRSWDGYILWTMTSRGHYFSKWVTSRGHSQRVTFPGHFW